VAAKYINSQSINHSLVAAEYINSQSITSFIRGSWIYQQPVNQIIQ